MRTQFNGVYGELDSLPGCSQVVVSHSVFTPAEYRGHGLGHLAARNRQEFVFGELGYDMMICTVDASNEVQQSILKKMGWTFMRGFDSRKTGHRVEMWACLPNVR